MKKGRRVIGRMIRLFKRHAKITKFHGLGFKFQSKVFFKNGYLVSVISGLGAYANAYNPFEVAIGYGNKDDWSLCYTTPITEDVEGYLKKEDVAKIMIQCKALKEA